MNESAVASLRAGLVDLETLPSYLMVTNDELGPETQAKIFRPFFTTKSAGTGLGLAISHKIVTAHGGDIAVAREDDRTVFRVLLPRRADAVPTARRQEAR